MSCLFRGSETEKSLLPEVVTEDFMAEVGLFSALKDSWELRVRDRKRHSQ